MRRILPIAAVASLVALAFAGGLMVGIRRADRSSMPDSWLLDGPVPLRGARAAVSYTEEALFESDVPLPDVESINAKVKFLHPPDPSKVKGRVLAYVVDVRVASLARDKIPARYRVEHVEQHKGGPATTMPLEQVTYVIKVTFDLEDRDGFKLSSVAGPDHWLESGKTNHLQEITSEPIDLSLAERVVGVRTRIKVIKCESCRND